MSQHTQANDWEIAIICEMGGADVLGGGVFFADVRSKKARTRSPFLFIGGGLGFGGSIGGASAPSPVDVVRNHVPDMYTKIPCKVRFSVDDLDCTSGRISMISLSFMYGYGIVRISAGAFPALFTSVNCNGWGVGVGAIGLVIVGMWKQLGEAGHYDQDIVAMLDNVNYNSDEMQRWTDLAYA